LRNGVTCMARRALKTLKQAQTPTKNLTKRLKRAPRPRPATDLEAQE
jgi:hypothetical protein